MPKLLPRRVVGICVGVDNTGVLGPLNAAGAGARRFHEWLLSQKNLGVQVHSLLFTEGNGPVRRKRILNAVTSLLKKGGCDVLYIYLAGHGLGIDDDDMKVLLSESGKDGAEAIHLRRLVRRVAHCGIPHVIIIWDACRTYANSDTLRDIQGGPIFPTDTGEHKKSGTIDLFLATARGEAAYEVPVTPTVAPTSSEPVAEVKNGADPTIYKAFFTETLLHEIAHPARVMTATIGGAVVPVLPSSTLAKRLAETVPLLALKSVPSFQQIPDITAASHLEDNQFFAVSPFLLGEFASKAPDLTRTADRSVGLRKAIAKAAGKSGILAEYVKPFPVAAIRGKSGPALGFRRVISTNDIAKAAGKKLFQIRVPRGTLVPMLEFRRDILAMAKGGGGGGRLVWSPGDEPKRRRNLSAMGKAIQSSFAAREKAESKLPKSIEDATNFYIDRTLVGKRTDPRASAAATAIAKSTGFDRVSDNARRTVGRPGFETHCGFTVIGADVKQFDVSSDPWKEVGSCESNEHERHYRVGPDGWGARGGTALFEFENETGIALAILPGYVGTVLVKDGQVRSVSYVPAKHTPAFAEYHKRRRAMDERRAIATAAAAFGKLENLARRAGPTLLNLMRVGTAVDPVLAVFAAYAQHLTGGHRQVRDIWSAMSRIDMQPAVTGPRVLTPIPFDVAMLAGKLTPKVVKSAPGIAPCVPWLSLGWSLLDDFDVELHPAIIQAGQQRLPGTWTSFTARGIRLLREAIQAGEIK